MIIMEGETLRRWVAQMKPYRKRVPILAVQIPEPFVVVQDAHDAQIRGRLVAKAGSWLAKSREGVYYPIAEEVFAETYEPITEQDPQ